MRLSKLIQIVGDENIEVQNLAENMASMNANKKHSTIAFRASPEKGNQIAKAACGLTSNVVGLVLWLPSDKIPKELK